MASSINASTTAGVVTTADTSGVLNIQTAGTTAIAISAGQAVSFTNAPTVTGGTANGVAFLNGSKVLTTGSALVFDGTNLGIKVTPSAWQGNNRAIQVADGYASLSGNSSLGTCDLSYNCYNSTAQAVLGWKYTNSSAAATLYQQLNGAHAWHIAPSGTANNAISFTQAMTLDSSGRLLVGTTSIDPAFNRSDGVVLSAGTILLRNSGAGSDFGMSTSSGTNISFYTDNGSARVTAGAITSNGASTAYGLGSDYRMKTNVQPMIGALAKVLKLNPVTFMWKKEFAGTNPNGQGFIAHELQEFYSDAVVGEKDAVNKDGSIKPQNVDTSFLVATLTAAIQEQQALITQLQADVAALKGA